MLLPESPEIFKFDNESTLPIFEVAGCVNKSFNGSFLVSLTMGEVVVCGKSVLIFYGTFYYLPIYSMVDLLKLLTPKAAFDFLLTLNYW